MPLYHLLMMTFDLHRGTSFHMLGKLAKYTVFLPELRRFEVDNVLFQK